MLKAFYFNKKIIYLLIFCLGVLGIASLVTAQTASQVLITWQALSFAPAEYQGKILPSTGTNIKLGLELVTENKLQDLSKADILWYLDEKLLGRGQGLKENVFAAHKGATDSHFVRVVVNYKNQEFDGTVDIPIINPRVVIETSVPTSTSISLGKNIFQAVPYFFNISNIRELIFNWTINDQTIKGDNLLELNLTAPPIPSNRNLNIKITAQNLNNNLEFGTKEINLNVQ
jgi:hypothetical protein